MTKYRSTGHECDVLILHGTAIEVVGHVKELLGSLGLSAQTVLDLPSKSKRQEQRVDYYIKNCRLPIVVASFDDSSPGSRKARANVYDEIGRCRAYKRQDAIILREVDTAGPVELGTNVDREAVTIHFDRSKLHTLAPLLLRELTTRNLTVGRSPAQQTMSTGKILNTFMDRMDDLWDNELDKAWDRIHSLDHEAESNFAIELDKFFQWYQRVFSAIVRDRKQGDELRSVCDEAIAACTLGAASAWEDVAEAKARKARDHAHGLDRNHEKNAHRKLFDDGSRELNSGKSLDASETGSRIQRFRKAVALLDQYITKHHI